MKKTASVLTLTLIFGLFFVANTFAQEEVTVTDTAKTEAASEAPKYGPIFQMEIKDQANGEAFHGMKVEKKFTRRLPNHYRDVISDEQRDKIYAVQSAYFGPVEMLTQRLDRLKAERDAQIEALLTAEQKKRIEALRKNASEQRAANRRAAQTAE